MALRAMAAVAATVAMAARVSSGADAHESRTVADGRYEMVVGFLDEPAFAGEPNGLSLRVSAYGAATPAAGADAGTGPSPVEGLDETLTAEVLFGDQAMELVLEASWGDPGHYEAIFFPMEPGDYTFRITGEIEGGSIDESFASSPNGFSPVQDPAPLRFPRDAGEATATAGFLAGGDSAGLAGPLLAGAVVGAAGVGLARRRTLVRV